MNKFRIKVLENIKGEMPEELFNYYDENSICPSFFFRAGGTYLIYTNKINENTFNSSACSGTDFFTNAGKEIQSVRDLAAGKSISTVFGKLEKFNYEREGRPEILLNVKATLLNQSGKKIETVTDKDGNYFFDKLPFGKYKLEFELPNDLWRRQDLTFEISKSPYVFQHNELALADGRIGGKFLNAEGKPRKKELIFLKEIDREINLPLTTTKTDENGNFMFYGLPKARYTIFDYLPDTFLRYEQESMPEFYLGNTADLKSAQIIALNHAEHVDSLEFRFPSEPPQIKGKITDEKNNGLEGADVFLNYSNLSGFFTKRIPNWKGEFSFPIFDEYKCEIYARVTYGKFKNLKSEKIKVSKADVGKEIKLVIDTKNK